MLPGAAAAHAEVGAARSDAMRRRRTMSMREAVARRSARPERHADALAGNRERNGDGLTAMTGDAVAGGIEVFDVEKDCPRQLATSHRQLDVEDQHRVGRDELAEPFAPYAISGGIVSVRRPPTFIPLTPSSQPRSLRRAELEGERLVAIPGVVELAALLLLRSRRRSSRCSARARSPRSLRPVADLHVDADQPLMSISGCSCGRGRTARQREQRQQA